MAYLTNYNLSKLCQKLEVKVDISLEMFIEHIYNDDELYGIFSKRQLKNLFTYKMLLDNEEKFMVEYLKEVPEEEDTKTMVYNKGGKMKYHSDLNCKNLVKDYLDSNVPEDIHILGDDAIDKYRKWFIANNFVERLKRGEIKKDQIIRAYNNKFPDELQVKPIEDNSNLLVIDLRNSGNQYIEEALDIDQLKKELSDLKFVWHGHFQSPVTKTLSKFSYLINKSDKELEAKLGELFSEEFISNYGIDNVKLKLQIANDIVRKITNLLLEYIRWALHIKSKKFNPITLEKLGLDCCFLCKKSHEIK